MAGWGDKVEQAVHAVVPEPGVTLDPGLLGNNVVVFPLEVLDNLAEAGLVVNLVAKTGCVDNRQCNSGALLIQLQFDRDRLDLDPLLDMGISRVVRVLVLENVLAAEGVDEGGASWSEQSALGLRARSGEAETYLCQRHHRP